MNQKTHRSSENERNWWFFGFFGENCCFFEKTKKVVKSRKFRSFSELRWDFWFKYFYWTRNTLQFMKTYDFSSLLLIAAHCCSLLLIFTIFLSSQHNFTCPVGKKKICILLLPRNKVRHGLDWWCTCIRKAFKPKILGEGVFGNGWEKLKK